MLRCCSRACQQGCWSKHRSFSHGVSVAVLHMSHAPCCCYFMQSEKDAPKMLKEYCKDLNAEVKAGRIDPVRARATGRHSFHVLQNECV